ncbi:YdcF family protein [Coleofasciculus sp. FACHB-542]|uniref:YdcF family protein n=1 Tax=Coleofasciculus sp. FACHB-542 TaxID=2692787 RepID=UPI001684B903|nr:YdcF family protein [Coleofasciculus sp. FACHB-542]MBD2087643.1 YdcF family protein [Coleofasciculus sp. FACHB-542]
MPGKRRGSSTVRDRINLSRRASFRRWRRLLILGIAIFSVILGTWLLTIMLTLRSAASGPVDAYLVLGGSIRREIYVAQLAKDYPQSRILISQGSPEPCILLIFQRENAPIERVWLEKCADSTFGNFYYSVPILREWGVKKVKLITSGTHLPRAKWLAQILMGAQGIWVEPEIVPEQGIPGNRESSFKTGLDLSRSLLWAMVSQVYQPKCSKLVPLKDVDIKDWRQRGFKCEHQGNLQ